LVASSAIVSCAAQTFQARKRLIKSGKKKWTVAVLVPTKRMTRQVSDSFRDSIGTIPAIPHSAAVDMEAAILAAEIIAFLMQPGAENSHIETFVELLCGYFRGKGGDTPSQSSMKEAQAIRTSFGKCAARERQGKAPPKNSIFLATQSVYKQTRSILDRGTQLRQALSQDWRDYGAYRNALEITRQAFVHEHFATAHKPETGVVIMNMHKAKGKQFDEVVIFEGWPRRVMGEIKSNSDRIIRSNLRTPDMGQARQNFRVSITRARIRTTILTPKDDPCVLLLRES
jgi:DNA helicase-2/ATP-dependent DNA helicase PcrA